MAKQLLPKSWLKKPLSLAIVDGQPRQVVKQFVQNNDIVLPEMQDPSMMCDATAIAVANIFDLDLSGCSSADEGTELVVATVNKFIQLFQQVKQQLSEANDQISEHEDTINDMQDQLNDQNQLMDENGNPIDADGNPLDPNGQPVDPDVDSEGNTNNPDENDVDGQGDPNGPQDDPPGDVVPNGPTGQSGKPVAGKGKQSAQKQKHKVQISIKASHTEKTLKLAAENRQLKITQLAAEGILTPYAARVLASKYTNDKALSLSLSDDSGASDEFDSLITVLRQNGPVINYGESMSDQTKFKPLALSHGTKPPKQKSVMVLEAESRQRKQGK